MGITLTEQGSIFFEFGQKPDVGYVVMPEDLDITVHFAFDLSDGKLVGMEIQDAESVFRRDFLATLAKPS